MTQLGTPGSPSATRLLLLGAGELGKEVAIAAQRLGVEVIAADRYANAPAMQVAHSSAVLNMLDGRALEALVLEKQPHFIVPEIEAIATDKLIELEEQGFHVVPTAKATRLTMDREGIRRLAAEELGLKTSPYEFAETHEEFNEAVQRIGLPCVVKPVMSSSGKGQSLLQSADAVDGAWHYAQEGARGGSGRVIVEGFVEFDYEITLLTAYNGAERVYSAPIGHRQERGDYRESWQPQSMEPAVLERAQDIARRVTEALGGRGLFGVELFIAGDEVLFSEVSPRPHDTGLVTLVSQELSEFELHVRAILGLPIDRVRQRGPSASAVILGTGESKDIRFGNLAEALAEADTDLRLFGKPEIQGERRLGVALARGATLDAARAKARAVAERVKLSYG